MYTNSSFTFLHIIRNTKHRYKNNVIEKQEIINYAFIGIFFYKDKLGKKLREKIKQKLFGPQINKEREKF